MFLLGAGFSHAISKEMPLMSDLGSAVARRFGDDTSLRNLLSSAELRVVDAGNVPLGNVEVWLSALAAEQPFLSASRNLQRRALFTELASQISDEIEQRRSQTCGQPMPPWLVRLVTIWHHQAAEVLTLNYDVLVEAAVASLKLRGSTGKVARQRDVTRSLPPELPTKGSFGHEHVRSFALRKLHGSTNWFGRASNSDLFSVVRVDALIPAWGAQPPRLGEETHALIAGLEPMILPPISDKSILYGNATMSSLWRQAHSALTEADDLVIVGYSVPQTDASILALLADALADDATITIVDVLPGDVANNLKPLGDRHIRETAQPGSTDFDQLLRQLEGALRDDADWSWCSELHPNCFVEGVLPDGTSWPVVAIQPGDEGLELVTAPAPNEPMTGLVNPSPNAVELTTSIDQIRTVRFPDGTRGIPVAGHLLQHTNEKSVVSLDVTLPN